MSLPSLEPGILYVVATPIGNLGDLTPRAREVLASVQMVAAEDTRHTGVLLRAFGIDTPLISLHTHNESTRLVELIRELQAGRSVALVSDAGTPLISDPGYAIVRAVVDAGIRAVPIPGPCAAIAALSISALPTDRFVFEGFLSAKTATRRAQLLALKSEQRTLVFYEAPHRLLETLQDLEGIFGKERSAAICRELTKTFETSYYGSLGELTALALQDANMVRGELVLIVEGSATAAASGVSGDAEQVLRTLLEELSPAQAAKLAARLTGVKRSSMYELAVRLGGGDKS